MTDATSLNVYDNELYRHSQQIFLLKKAGTPARDRLDLSEIFRVSTTLIQG